MTPAADRPYWLAWSRVTGVGPVLLGRLQTAFGSLETAWHAPASDLRGVEGIGPHALEGIRRDRRAIDPDTLYAKYSRANPQFWTPADPDYPRLLLETPSPPPVLHYSGRVDRGELSGSTPLVGIVGTRNPTDYGKRWTHRVSAALAQHGFAVISGLATGIDTEAHRACLDAGGRTIAVLGTGVDLIYPASNRRLYTDIEQHGLLLSEYPAGTKPERSHFPVRNRIIAGLSRAVLVMEAPSKSGALITARYASDFNRDVYVLPGSLDNDQAIGCLGLLGSGAHAILSEGHLLELLGEIPQLDLFDRPAPTPVPPPPHLDPDLARVLAVLSEAPLPLDRIVQVAELPASDVSVALLQLELLGLAVQAPGLRYQRA